MRSLDVDPKQLAEICARHHVHELSVFGSVARGEAGCNSDVDVLVEFDPAANVGFVALAQFTRDLQELLNRPVDVVSKRGLNPRIRDAVLADAEVLFAA